jgi:hypothetical protein
MPRTVGGRPQPDINPEVEAEPTHGSMATHRVDATMQVFTGEGGRR